MNTNNKLKELNKNSGEFLYKDISERIIGAAFEVHNQLGYGFLEKVYCNALVEELKQNNLQVGVEFFISNMKHGD